VIGVKIKKNKHDREKSYEYVYEGDNLHNLDNNSKAVSYNLRKSIDLK